MRKNSNQQSLKDAIREMMDSCSLTDRYQQTMVQANWKEIMGPTVARYTNDLFVKDGTLHIFVSSAPLKNELLIMKSKIIERVNEEIGAEVISDIAIR